MSETFEILINENEFYDDAYKETLVVNQTILSKVNIFEYKITSECSDIYFFKYFDEDIIISIGFNCVAKSVYSFTIVI